MKKFLAYIAIIVLIGYCCSCVSGKDKCLQKLFEATGIEMVQIQTATHLVIIPGNGCGSCIEKATSEMHVSQDTLYVVACRSEKDFYLLTGNRRNEYPNVYLDTRGDAVVMQMVGTAPMVYVLDKGKFISCAPYEEERKDTAWTVTTTISVDKEHVDWGRFSHEEIKEASFILKNTGHDSLHIDYIASSCECLHANISRFHIAPEDTVQLKVFFRSDSIGDFIRKVFVHGNFEPAPLLLTVEGNCR